MTFVTSDLHGNFDKFKALLDQLHFTDADTLFIVGDILDYGDQPMELVNDLSVRSNVFPVAGEHDYRAAKMLKGFTKMVKTGKQPDAEFVAEMTDWVHDGGQQTLEAFRELDEEEREGVLDYLEEMTLFEETEVNGQLYTMVHAGIADFDPDEDLADCEPEVFFSEPLDPSVRLIEDSTLIVGHRPTESGKIERGEGSIFLDCGNEKGGKLAAICLETGKEYYV